jgi:putative oxidoreductase
MKAMRSLDSKLSPDLGLLIVRLMAGAVFAFHGAQKLFGLFGGHGVAGTAGWMESLGVPFPVAATVLAGGAELLGGLALVTGLGLRWLSLPLTFTMLVAAFTAHSGFAAQAGGMEYPLTLAAVALGLGLTGPGRFALRAPGTQRAGALDPALS